MNILANWLQRFMPKPKQLDVKTWLSSITAIGGSLYRTSDLRGSTDIMNIRNKINIMRALAEDSQISTALSYYATDATTTNSAGDIIWATVDDTKDVHIADIVNGLLKKWKVNQYARDHILELATIGNLYLPTTYYYRQSIETNISRGIALDNNTIPDDTFNIIASKKIPPEDIVHLWKMGVPKGYVLNPSDDSTIVRYPETACIHFALGGLLGDYTITLQDADGDTTYDVQFAEPLMYKSLQPTQTLNLLEDSILLSSLSRTVRFINVDCGNTVDTTEIEASLTDIKMAIEQQLSLNTSSGDAQSFVNPQSPTNLIYVPKINGNDPISVTDLNMADATEADNKLLSYYQDKKLSVLGVPKEAMNFSSNEGLGGAGSVLAQRSAIYANALQRIETAYIAGWTDAINKYFQVRNLNKFVDKFKLHMNPIITLQSTVQFDKRDSAIAQASNLVSLMKSVGVDDANSYKSAMTETLSEALPQTGAEVNKWDLDTSNAESGF